MKLLNNNMHFQKVV